MIHGPDALASALADRYILERELGQGGMATVYLAEDLKHRRKVGGRTGRAGRTGRSPARAHLFLSAEADILPVFPVLPAFPARGVTGANWDR